MAVNDSTRLGCGRDIDDVWEHVEQPPDAHEQTCPDCRAARESLSELVRASNQLHAADDADADLQTSPLVLTRILDIARAEVRRGRRLPLSKPRPGEVSVELSVSEQAVASVVRRACDRNPLVHLRRCGVELVTQTTGPPLATVDDSGSEPSDVRLSLRVSVDASASIPRVADELRTEIRRTVDLEVGMNVIEIEIVVEDLHND